VGFDRAKIHRSLLRLLRTPRSTNRSQRALMTSVAFSFLATRIAIDPAVRSRASLPKVGSGRSAVPVTHRPIRCAASALKAAGYIASTAGRCLFRMSRATPNPMNCNRPEQSSSRSDRCTNRIPANFRPSHRALSRRRFVCGHGVSPAPVGAIVRPLPAFN
jgi:hypothetical protein